MSECTGWCRTGPCAEKDSSLVSTAMMESFHYLHSGWLLYYFFSLSASSRISFRSPFIAKYRSGISCDFRGLFCSFKIYPYVPERCPDPQLECHSSSLFVTCTVYMQILMKEIIQILLTSLVADNFLSDFHHYLETEFIWAFPKGWFWREKIHTNTNIRLCPSVHCSTLELSLVHFTEF